MQKVFRILRNGLDGEEGATVVEYGLLLTLICVITLAIISLLGTTLSSFFSSVASSI
jgi:pilus assembly protein Flp/PilA